MTFQNLYFRTLPKVESTRYINVPVALLQEVKNDSLQWSIAALSVALKCFSPSSTYIFVSEKKFRNDFHLGQQKARKLLDAIRGGHPLFEIEYNRTGDGLIRARCYRRIYAHTMVLRSGRRSLDMTVIKATKMQTNEISISKIERELRHLLLLLDINNKTRADELQSKGTPLKGGSAHAASTTLSVPYLAAATGRSSRTILRMTKDAVNNKEISVTRYPLWRVCDDMLHGTTPTEGLIRVGNLGFTRRCNDYTMLSWELRHRFQHIIFSHRRRLTHNISVSDSTPLSQTDLHALFD